MSVEIRRSRSLRGQDLRPSGFKSPESDKESRTSERSDRRPNRSVSFNRDVHVKRYARKLDRQLSRIDESPVESDDMKDLTIKNRGRADGTEEVKWDREVPVMSSKSTYKNAGKEGLTQRIKAFFSGRSKNKTATTTSTATDADEDLSSRYKEYRGSDTEFNKNRRRDSAPEAKQNWLRSLERSKKSDSKMDLTDGRFSQSERNLRYFGESDAEKYSSLARTRRSRYFDDTSQDDTTDAEVSNRYGSLVYLHAAAVRDIPPKSGGSRLGLKEPDPSTLRRRTKKNLTRSLSMSGPWTPQHKPKTPVNNYKSTTTIGQYGGARDVGVQTISRSRGLRSEDVDSRRYRSETPTVGPRSRELPKLVFTGPSIDQTLRRHEWRGRV